MDSVELTAPRKVDLTICRQLKTACQILYVEGQNDINHGQVSARIPQEELYWVRGAALGFDEVEDDDFVQADLKGNVRQGKRTIPPEWPIHAAIYRTRKDVSAIVHSHPPNAIVFGSIGQPLLPLSHDGCFFQDRLGMFDATTNTILTMELAEQMVAQLGDGRAVLLKNHGIVTVGRSVKEATVTALLLERACGLQLRVPNGVEAIGSPEGDIEPKRGFIFNDVAIATYWSYAQRKLERIRQGAQLPEPRL
jgi:L-fuculose-phosphate aldolase